MTMQTAGEFAELERAMLLSPARIAIPYHGKVPRQPPAVRSPTPPML
jgi:hypothetical protein